MTVDRAFLLGFRKGLRDVLAIGSHEAPAPFTRRTVGSLHTDGAIRYRDMERFGDDVARERRRVVRA